MSVHHAADYLGEFFDVAIEELHGLISRRFAVDRTIRLEVAPDGRWCAIVYTGDADKGKLVFPPCENLGTVYRFVKAFARKEGVAADVSLVEATGDVHGGAGTSDGHSVRVPPKLTVVQ